MTWRKRERAAAAVVLILKRLADAERDGEVEDSQNSGPHVLDEQVADEGRGDGAVGRFTDANLNKTKASLGK